MAEHSYIDTIQQHRMEREKRLLANPRNWFSLAGLFPLAEGNNLLGGDSSDAIALPGKTLPSIATLELSNRQVTLTQDLSGILLNGKISEYRVLNTDHDADTDVLSFGSIQMVVLQRGDRFFLRVWDTESEKARKFAGLNYFPIDPAWCIQSDFTYFEEPRILPVDDVIGTKYEVSFVGQAFFTVNGTSCSLIAEKDEDELLFSFSDLTKSDLTYPAGRFLLTSQAENGLVTLDFNLARNWPCAYTSFATCPLPPFENHLKVRIEAGEKRFQ